MTNHYSYSRVKLFGECPFKYKCRYIDKIPTETDYTPNNALYLGTALHLGIDEGVESAIDNYYKNYLVINDLNVNEAIKLENIVPKCQRVLPLDRPHEFEREVNFEGYLGYIDLLIKNDDGTYDMYDFKYSNNIDNYMESEQLHVYKYMLEQSTDIVINKMYFLFAPKTFIRQKRDETLEQFRMRLRETLTGMEVVVKEVQFNPDKVLDFLALKNKMYAAKEYPKKENRYCSYCEFKEVCTMNLPKNEKRKIEKSNYKKIWLYGMPFSGKTYLANQFPDVLMLNTDGNIKFVDAPYVAIKDEVTMNGRIKDVKYAWEIFKETIDELEKKENDFKTIVVDLLEDVYDSCRVKVCHDRGWSHESDDSFKAYDIVRSEFLRELKRLTNLDYNIILISHEDASRDITARSGNKITSIQPNINDKLAKKIAGMVDVVGRCIHEDNTYQVCFKANEVIFGGGRLDVNNVCIPSSVEEINNLYSTDELEEVAKEVAEEPKKRRSLK